MPRTQAEIDRENRRHDQEVDDIKERFKLEFELILKDEGASSETILSVTIALEAIVALLIPPEPSTKALAVILVVMVGIVVAYWLIKMLISKSSKSDTLKAWDERKAKLKEENERHEQILLN